MLNAVYNAIDKLTEGIGKTIAWLTLIMMLVTCLVVLLRYGFNIGSIALQETVTYLHAIVLLMGAGYTLKHNGHVRVDILYQRFSYKIQAWIDLLGTLLFLFPVCIFIIWFSWDYVASSIAIQEKSQESGGLPFVYLLKLMIPTMAVLLLIQGIAEAIKNINILKNPPATSKPSDPLSSGV